jgi:hypothetical protein
LGSFKEIAVPSERENRSPTAIGFAGLSAQVSEVDDLIASATKRAAAARRRAAATATASPGSSSKESDGRSQQPFSWQRNGSACVLASVVEIALGHNTKRSHGAKHPAFGAVDLIHAIAFSDWPALTSTWQVEVFREYISRIALLIAVTLTCAAAAAEVAIPRIATITLVVANLVTVQHSRRLDFPADRRSGNYSRAACSPSMNSHVIGRNEPLALVG